MVTIKIRDVKEWVALDFVNYFKAEYEKRYEQTLSCSYAKDCSIMKRIITAFQKNNRVKQVIPTFIDWAFDKYDKVKHKTSESSYLTIGYLETLLDEFLPVKVEKKVKKSTHKKIELSEETKKWIEEQKKIYKAK